MAKLFITDHGDLSVGIFFQEWIIECPFESNADKEEIEFFRTSQIECFENYTFGKVTAEYDFECDAITK